MDHANDSAVAATGASRLLAAMRRQARLFLVFSVLGAALGLVYIVNATPLYTASASIIVNNRPVRAIRDVSTLSDAPLRDSQGVSSDIESQVEFLRSEQVGLAVVRHFDLVNDPEASGRKKSSLNEMLEFVKAQLGLGAKPSLAPEGPAGLIARQLAAVEKLNRNLRVGRVGRTYVLEVGYSAPNPVKAAEIANGYANAFVLEQLNARVEATRRAGAWLKQRTDELRELLVAAETEAQKFRTENNLLQTKGALVSEQRINELTTLLVNAQADTSRARARYLRLKNIIDTRQTDSAVTESLTSPTVNELRTRYLDASNRMKDLQVSRKLEPTHAAVVNLQNSLDEISARLFEELGRVAESYRNDYEIAVTREKALNDDLARQQRVAVVDSNAQVHLRQLEEKVDSYKRLYETYMQRFQESAQQETSPIGDEYIVSPANPPLSPSSPRKPAILALSLALGALAGAGAGMIREMRDRAFRTAEQVRDELGVDVIGMLPVLSADEQPPSVRGAMPPIMRYAIDNPFSSFAETLRSAKVSADLGLHDRTPKIIGIVSLLPGEGKSTVAKNFASLVALQGATTLLIDADTRNPTLTRAIGCEKRQGSKDRDLRPLAELMKLEPDSNLRILPCIYARDDPRVADGFSSAMLRTLLQGSDQSFQFVVIDLPPIGPVVNARGLASAIDAFILVVAWGATSRDVVRAVLAKEHSIRDKLLGVVLNKVDAKKLKRYEHAGSDGYYQGLYDKYYTNAENRAEPPTT